MGRNNTTTWRQRLKNEKSKLACSLDCSKAQRLLRRLQNTNGIQQVTVAVSSLYVGLFLLIVPAQLRGGSYTVTPVRYRGLCH